MKLTLGSFRRCFWQVAVTTVVKTSQGPVSATLQRLGWASVSFLEVWRLQDPRHLLVWKISDIQQQNGPCYGLGDRGLLAGQRSYQETGAPGGPSHGFSCVAISQAILIRGHCARSLWFTLSGHQEICSDAESTHAMAKAYILVYGTWCAKVIIPILRRPSSISLFFDAQPRAHQLEHVCHNTHVTSENHPYYNQTQT